MSTNLILPLYSLYFLYCCQCGQQGKDPHMGWKNLITLKAIPDTTHYVSFFINKIYQAFTQAPFAIYGVIFYFTRTSTPFFPTTSLSQINLGKEKQSFFQLKGRSCSRIRRVTFHDNFFSICRLDIKKQKAKYQSKQFH